MTTITIDSRHPLAASAIESMRSGDLERTGIFAHRPELAMRVVRRVTMDMRNRIVARAMILETESPEWWDTRATAEELAETMTRRPTKLRTSACE